MNFTNLVTSEKTDLIFPALIATWSKLDAVKKDITNEFHHNKYADINSFIETVKEPLIENGLMLMQPASIDKENPRRVTVETIIVHAASGQFISNVYTLEATDGKPQSMGSVTTYARRYPLASLLGLQSEVDDDGNAASGVNKSSQPAPRKQTATTAPAQRAAPAAIATAVKDPKLELTQIKEKLMKDTGIEPKSITDYFVACGLAGGDPKPYMVPLKHLVTVIESNPTYYGPAFKEDPKSFGEQWKDAQSKTAASN